MNTDPYPIAAISVSDAVLPALAPLSEDRVSLAVAPNIPTDPDTPIFTPISAEAYVEHRNSPEIIVTIIFFHN